MGIRLSQEEMDALADHFIEDGPHIQPPQIVNHKAFCEVIDECFGVLAGVASAPRNSSGENFHSSKTLIERKSRLLSITI